MGLRLILCLDIKMSDWSYIPSIFISNGTIYKLSIPPVMFRAFTVQFKGSNWFKAIYHVEYSVRREFAVAEYRSHWIQSYIFFIFSDTYRPVRYCSLNPCDLCIYSIWPFIWLMKLVWLRPWLNTPHKNPFNRLGSLYIKSAKVTAFSRMKIITFWNIFHERLYLPFKLATSNRCYCCRQPITLLNDTQFTDVYISVYFLHIPTSMS